MGQWWVEEVVQGKNLSVGSKQAEQRLDRNETI
jgi:hypothetical protein